MKFKIIVLFLFITIQSFAQISVGSKHIGRSSNFKKGVLEKFKNTETIFLLSSIFNKQEYENILKDSWTVTPYKIVELENFNITEYFGKDFNIAQLSGFKRTRDMQYGGGQVVNLHAYIDIKLYDGKEILEKLEKLKPEQHSKKINDILEANSYDIARFYIFPKDDFIVTALDTNMNTTVNSLYTEDVFFNYKLGFLKNYFQKINNLIKDEEVYWLYEDDYLPELQKLKNNTLFIPSYISIKFKPFKGEDGEENNENIEDIFDKYDFKYEIIDDEKLSDKILATEPIYYLRYVRTNAERFIQVVNSITGEIIYRNYIAGLSYQIKSKQIKDLNSTILKASKK